MAKEPRFSIAIRYLCQQDSLVYNKVGEDVFMQAQGALTFRLGSLLGGVIQLTREQLLESAWPIHLAALDQRERKFEHRRVEYQRRKNARKATGGRTKK